MASGLLSDDELRRQLQGLGAVVGPITDSTRAAYQRQLRKLRHAAPPARGRGGAAIKRLRSSLPSSPRLPAYRSPAPLASPQRGAKRQRLLESPTVKQHQRVSKHPPPKPTPPHPSHRPTPPHPSHNLTPPHRPTPPHPSHNPSPPHSSHRPIPRLYPTLPTDSDDSEEDVEEMVVSKRTTEEMVVSQYQELKRPAASPQRLPVVSNLAALPTPVNLPDEQEEDDSFDASPISRSSPLHESASSSSLTSTTGSGIVKAVTGLIGAGMKKIFHPFQSVSPRPPMPERKSFPSWRKPSASIDSEEPQREHKPPPPPINPSWSPQSNHSISLDDFEIDAESPESVFIGEAPGDSSGVSASSSAVSKGEASTSYDWELQPCDVEICKKSDGTLWRLGKGGFGEVFRGIKDGVDEVAVKVIRIESSTSASKQFKNEIDMISKLRHRHILQFYGACIKPNCLYMVTELMQTDLFSALKTEKRYRWSGIYGRPVITGIASGIHYLHSRKPPVVHRDIKSPNILVMDGTVKIADVGIARTKADSDMTAQRGFTIAWAAPEVVYRKRATEKIDIWSFGIILWEVVTGSAPRSGHLVLPPSVPPLLRELYDKCTNDIATNRPSAAGILRALKHI